MLRNKNRPPDRMMLLNRGVLGVLSRNIRKGFGGQQIQWMTGCDSRNRRIMRQEMKHLKERLEKYKTLN